MTSPHNVLLIIADDWSPLARCYGNDVIHTPNIDKLADRSTVFTHAFCTSPSCGPSRACLLTGQHVHTHGQYGHPHDRHGFNTFRHVTSLPSVLNDYGYKTANIGKHHVSPDETYPYHLRDESDGWSSRALSQTFKQFLADAGDSPFFTMYAPMYPHRRGEGCAYGLDEHQDEFNDRPVHPDDVTVPDFLPDHPSVRRDLAAYYQAVSRFDHCVGEALDVLEQAGKADDTLVLLLSDHGMPFPGAKASPFDTGHHCPLIVHHPKNAPSLVKNNALVNWTDIAPTVYQWCEIPQRNWPTPLHGKSFLSLLGNTTADGAWDETYLSHCFHGIADHFPYRILRDQRYKFIRNVAACSPLPMPTDLFRSTTWHYVLTNQVEMLGYRATERLLHHDEEALFDIQADPLETNNLIHDPSMTDIAEQMRTKLKTFRQNTNDPWLEIDHQQQVTRNARQDIIT